MNHSKYHNNQEETDEQDDVQTKMRGIQNDTCMHPTNSIHSGIQEYSIVPGEGKMPMDIFTDKRCEALAFPTLFPTRRFTYNTEEDNDTNPVKRKQK